MASRWSQRTTTQRPATTTPQPTQHGPRNTVPLASPAPPAVPRQGDHVPSPIALAPSISTPGGDVLDGSSTDPEPTNLTQWTQPLPQRL